MIFNNHYLCKRPLDYTEKQQIKQMLLNSSTELIDENA